MTKIYLDMDGVLADFVTGVQGPDYLDGPLKSEEQYDDTKKDLILKRLFKNLPPMPNMLKLVSYVKQTGLPWEILTCSGEIERPLVVADKVNWIREHVDYNVVVTSTLKGKHKAIFAKKGDILVDDKKSNVEAWKDAGGIGILHTDIDETIEELKTILFF